MKKIVIDSSIEGGRLDKFLNRHLPNAGSSFIYKMLRKKNITLNGKKADGKEIIKAGDSVEIFFSDETYEKFRGKTSDDADKVNIIPYQKAFNQIKEIDVVYEDSDVLIINKGVGVLSQKASDNDMSANEWLIGYLLNKNIVTKESLQEFKPSVCNRLDRNTAGLLMCGKTLKGSRALSKLIKDRNLSKFYQLLVKGSGIEECILTGKLDKDSEQNKVEITSSKEDNIKTGIRPISSNGLLTLVEAELFTGKPHQIRAHLASIGHPLIGDYKYGNKSVNDAFKRDYGLESQFLCCVRLEFPNDCNELPQLSGLVVKAELPKLFQEILIKEKL